MTLSVRDLCAGYRGREVLSSLNFGVQPGAVVGLIGPNGSGKSTLLKSIAGLHPFRGEVTLNGAPVASWNRRVLQRRIAFLPQGLSANTAMQVQEVVLLGLIPDLHLRVTDDQRQAVLKALRALSIEHLANRRITEISGGQRQLVFLAQAMIRRPAVLLLDEPTSALDLHHQLRLLSILRDLVSDEGRYVICALHDLNLAAGFCDQIVVLHAGTLEASGRPADVLTQHLLQRCFNVNARISTRPDDRPQITLQGPL